MKRSRRRERDSRMGALPPRYSFFLNPYATERFTRCPRCQAPTRIRKIPLVIHIDPIGLVLLRKTCRLCVVCEMLIADETEVDRAVGALIQSSREARRSYLVLGTLAPGTWRQGLSGDVTIAEIRENMADFKAYMRVEITPRHWARRDADID